MQFMQIFIKTKRGRLLRILFLWGYKVPNNSSQWYMLLNYQIGIN